MSGSALVSRSQSGIVGNRLSIAPDISADGSVVAFVSRSDCDPLDLDDIYDV